MTNLHTPKSQGFTLFIALIFTAVILTVGIGLLDITYKQTLLSSTAKNSTVAFYNADSALECALYWDSQLKFGLYTTNPVSGTISCAGGSDNINYTATTKNVIADDGSTLKYDIYKFTIPCPGDATPGDGSGTIQIWKANAATASNPYYTFIYATGYNSCSPSDKDRTERGLKAYY